MSKWWDQPRINEPHGLELALRNADAALRNNCPHTADRLIRPYLGCLTSRRREVLDIEERIVDMLMQQEEYDAT